MTAKGGALALSGAVIAWGVALIHLVNGFTRPLGIIEVRSISPTGAAQERESMSVSAVEGATMPLTDVYLHRPLDKIDLILFFALVGTACFLGYRLARRGARGARDVLDGSPTSRWLGIVLVAVGVVPAFAQQQGSFVRLADAGLVEVLAPSTRSSAGVDRRRARARLRGPGPAEGGAAASGLSGGGPLDVHLIVGRKARSGRRRVARRH
ncbi:hypothetical protein NKG05_07620 [Oerskovia sp. M15]